MNNNELIKQALELCEKATPGPWKSKKTADYSEIYDNHSWGKALNPLAMVGSNLEDAAFIAASRTLVPQLRDALEAEQKEIEQLKTQCDINATSFFDMREQLKNATSERDTYKATLQNWHEPQEGAE